MPRARELAVLVGMSLSSACAAIYGVGDLPSDVDADADGARDAGHDGHVRLPDASHPHDGPRGGPDGGHDASVDGGHDAGHADAPMGTDAGDAPSDVTADDVVEAQAGPVVLSVTPSPATVAQGQSAMLTVTLASPATADLTLNLTSLPAGVTAPPGSIPTGSTTGILAVSASATATEGLTSPSVNAGGPSLPFELVISGATATLDTSFNQSGVQNIIPAGGGSDATARSVAIQADGSILIAGTVSAGATSAWALVRLKPDGTLDTAFNANVVDSTKGALLPTGGNLAGVAVMPSGRIVVAGYDTDGGIGELAVLLYNADGTRDEAFGLAGLYTHGPDEGFHVTTVTGVAVNAAGTIAVVGNTVGAYIITLSGATNSAFNETTAFPANVEAQGVVYEPNGDLVVGGSDPSGGGQLYIGRFTSSLGGEAFADGGIFGPPSGTGNQYLLASALARDPSGNVFLVGSDNQFDPIGAYSYVANDGTGVLPNGYVKPGPNAMNGSGYLGVACGATDNLAVVVGQGYDMAGNIAFVARIKSTGGLDTTFGSNGSIEVNNMTAPVYDAVAIDAVGRIVVVGSDDGFYAMRIWP